MSPNSTPDMMVALRNLLEAEIKRVGSRRLLAQRMGIGESTLYHIMAGREPQMDTLKSIAGYFDVPTPQLLSAEAITEIKPISERIFATLGELEYLLRSDYRNRQQ